MLETFERYIIINTELLLFIRLTTVEQAAKLELNLFAFEAQNYKKCEG